MTSSINSIIHDILNRLNGYSMTSQSFPPVMTLQCIKSYDYI